MDQKQIDILTQKIADRSISDTELKQYYAWLLADDQQPLQITSAATEQELRERIFSAIAQKSGLAVAQPKRIKLWPRYLSRTRIGIAVAAAVVLVMLSAGLFFYKTQVNENTLVATQDIAPGKNGATLTLANGQKILIDETSVGNIAAEAGVKISKTKDGQLVYELTGSNSVQLAYNTLSTSRGQQSQVRLPDGTVVFLNAESSLRYPNSFVQTAKREVELTGEGYFSVSKDKRHPFVVRARGQQIEVLGTQFNVNTYSNEQDIHTTLVEGSVRVSNAASKQSAVIAPGQQARISGASLAVVDVEVDDVIAWKEGYFTFNRQPLSHIMNDVARWYNVEVVFEQDSLKELVFFGSISRFDKVSRVLKLLEKTSDVKFEIKNNTIIVSKKD